MMRMASRGEVEREIWTNRAHWVRRAQELGGSDRLAMAVRAWEDEDGVMHARSAHGCIPGRDHATYRTRFITPSTKMCPSCATVSRFGRRGFTEVEPTLHALVWSEAARHFAARDVAAPFERLEEVEVLEDALGMRGLPGLGNHRDLDLEAVDPVIREILLEARVALEGVLASRRALLTSEQHRRDVLGALWGSGREEVMVVVPRGRILHEHLTLVTAFSGSGWNAAEVDLHSYRTRTVLSGPRGLLRAVKKAGIEDVTRVELLEGDDAMVKEGFKVLWRPDDRKGAFHDPAAALAAARLL